MSHHFIEFDDVFFSYPGGQEALQGVSFRITHGEKVALLGLNGSGKSTILLHTNGLLLPTRGTVNVGGIPVTRRTAPDVRRSVGMVFQNPDDQLFMPTVEEDVAFGPLNMGLDSAEVRRRVTDALHRVGAENLAKRAPFQLSGGQKKAVALATVLSMEPDIMVMDEPTAELDLRARRRVADIISRFSHSCLIATHDMDLAHELCPRAILVSDGRIVADGPVAEVIHIFTDLMKEK
ncbi:MAG: energy-coupling factor ABC transporter ATP-binding protein [Muribaculaceae bacterium]|nr:energy-coupling factor ABC transporter ATP-binding protein [Muribaculaceae bacterium]